MKTTFMIEVETKDSYNVHPDCEKQPEDYSKEELKEYRETFTKELHEAVVKFMESYGEEHFEENLMDSTFLDECSIEGWETLEDYGIKLNIKKVEK